MFGLDLSRCKGGIMVDISEEEERDFFLGRKIKWVFFEEFSKWTPLITCDFFSNGDE